MRDFVVVADGKSRPVGAAPLHCATMKEALEESDDDTAYFVRIKWLHTLPAPYWEKGMRANQNTVIRLRHAFTREKLLAKFGLSE